MDGHSQGERLILDRRELSPDALAVPSWEERLRQLRRFAGAAVWPRAHLGKDFSALSFAQAGLLLSEGGSLWMAARKNKGAKSLAQILERVFGQKAEIVSRIGGYSVYRVQKSESFDEEEARKLVSQRYEIFDPRLPAQGLHSAPGVFSRKALDAGTAALIDALEEDPQLATQAPRRVLDLCCGVGPLAIYAATRWPQAQVMGVESNLVAHALACENFERLGLSERGGILNGNGLPEPRSCPPRLRPMAGRVRLALVNPPTHAPPEALERLFAPLPNWMGQGARAFFVVARPGSVSRALERCGALVQAQERGSYWILIASWPAPSLSSPL